MRAVRDALEASRAAAIQIRGLAETEATIRESLGVGGHTYEVHPKNGIRDPMRKVVSLMAWEEEHAETADLEAVVAEGRGIVRGAEAYVDPLGLEVLRRYYVEGEQLRRISNSLGDRLGGVLPCVPSKRDQVVQRALEATVDGLEDIGMAHLRRNY